MSRISILVAVVLAVCVIAGCGRRGEVRCEDPSRYSTSDSIPPVRVPEGLSFPDDSESLVIPPGARSARSGAEGECLEAPPDFFGEEAEEDAQDGA